MYEVKIRKGESIDDALQRLRRLREDDIKGMERRRHYEKPSDIRKKRRTLRKGGNTH